MENDENKMNQFTDISESITEIPPDSVTDETSDILQSENPEDFSDRNEEINPEPEKKKITAKTLIKNISEFFSGIGIPDMFIIRFIGVFFLFSGTNISEMNKSKINSVTQWKEFIGEASFLKTVISMASAFLLLTLIYRFMPKKFRIIDQSVAIASILYFDIVLLWRGNDVYLSIGVMLVSVVFIYYAVSKLRTKNVYNRIPWWIYGILVLASAVLVTSFVALTSVCRHKNFGSSTHDFGLFVQMYHYLSTDLTAVTTCERDKFLSHFYIHASYIFYALVPVYKLFPKGETLLISQAVLAMGGVIPMFLIAKRHNMKGLALMFMGIAYVFCTGLIGPCYYDFHENCFLPTLLMWLLWAVDGKKYVAFYIFSILVCIVKEDAPLYVVCIGMYMFFENKKNIGRINGIIMAVIAGGYMMFITNWLTENGDGQMMTSTRFGFLMIDPNGGLKEVIKNTFADPAYFFSLLVKEHTIKFFIQMMLPLLFLPFFTRKLNRYLLMIPFIIMNLVVGSGYGYAADVGYQYVFGPSCLLLYMCIINLEDMGQARRQEIPILLGSAAIIMTMGTMSHYISYYENYLNTKEYNTSLEEMLDRIPHDAAVACDTWLVPHIANRDEVYLLDNNDYNASENKIVDPERYDFFVIPVGTELYNNIQPLFEEMGITLYDKIDGRIEIYESPLYDIYKTENAE